MKKNFEAGFKVKVALEALKGDKTISQLSAEYGVHSNRITRWKYELQKRAIEIFNTKGINSDKSKEEQIDKLFKSIGELKVENDWLKKKLNLLI